MSAGTPEGEISSATLRLTVFGANGGTGGAADELALKAGHYVTAVTRHPEQFTLKHERLMVFRGDATVPADVRNAIEGADAVLSALGVPYSRPRSRSIREVPGASWTPWDRRASGV